MRYEILHRFGGIFLEADSYCSEANTDLLGSIGFRFHPVSQLHRHYEVIRLPSHHQSQLWFSLAVDLDEVDAHRDIESPAGLDKGVGCGQALATVDRSSVQEVSSTDAGLFEGAREFAIVDFEAAIGKTPFDIGTLVRSVPDSLGELARFSEARFDVQGPLVKTGRG